MLRGLILAAAILPVTAGLLPDYYNKMAKANSHAIAAPDPALFEEYGFDQSEKAEYGRMIVTAWRFRDTTGAFSGFQYLRPADAKNCDMGKVAACTPAEDTIARGNYVLQFAGKKPKAEEVNFFLAHAPRWEESPIPALPGFLPEDGLIPNSERYVLGPVGLERFGKGIPPSVAAFHLSAEGEYARYKGKNSEFGFVLFSYPVPNMARDQAEAFRKLPGVIVKRTGPLVAAVVNAPNADDAERLLSRMNWQATVTLNQVPERNQAIGWARALLNMLFLTGAILVFCLISGILFGGFRVLRYRLGIGEPEDTMIRLRLD